MADPFWYFVIGFRRDWFCGRLKFCWSFRIEGLRRQVVAGWSRVSPGRLAFCTAVQADRGCLVLERAEARRLVAPVFLMSGVSDTRAFFFSCVCCGPGCFGGAWPTAC